MKDDRRTANIDRDILKLIFDRVCFPFVSVYSHTNTSLIASRKAFF